MSICHRILEMHMDTFSYKQKDAMQRFGLLSVSQAGEKVKKKYIYFVTNC